MSDEVLQDHFLAQDPGKNFRRYLNDENQQPANEPLRTYETGIVPPKPRRKKILIILSALAALAVIVIAVAVPVSLTKSSKKGNYSSAPKCSKGTATSGTPGSVIVQDDCSSFTYVNDFGGDWAFDPTNPFGSGGKAQSWSPRVGSEQWTWGTDIARGVNLGGWLVTQPFITPSLYEPYINSGTVEVVDEWTLSQAMGSKLTAEMTAHYSTFITEKDFAEIAAAGLNWVRIPIGFWAISKMSNEPFLEGVSWTYFLKAIEWARKYGLRIVLDLNALPGSQNGWDHSGKAGSINLMNGVMGLANAQRSFSYMRVLAEFISQPQYLEVVPVLGVANDINWNIIGQIPLQSFYFEAYETIRSVTGFGVGAGPYVAIQDGFKGCLVWEGFLEGADRVILDQHPLLSFLNDTTDPVDTMAVMPCGWALATNRSSQNFGITLGGEFNSAPNDCGLWVNGIVSGTVYPNCEPWNNWASYNQTFIASLKKLTMNNMDSLQNWFFMTWKIGNSTVLGTSSSPLWNYQLGLAQGWIPSDPREAYGLCASILGNTSTFNGVYPATATGGSGAGTIAPAQITSHAFPPTTLMPSFSGTQIGLLPTYTATGTEKTLPPPTFTAAPTASVGSGWYNASDTASAYVPVNGCSYPDAWNAVNAPLPVLPCGGH